MPDLDKLFKRLDELLDRVEQFVPGAAEPVQVTISIGAVMGGGGNEDSTAALVEKADQALYNAKDGGRKQVTLFPECTQAA